MSMQLGNGFISGVKKNVAALLGDKEIARPERQRGLWSFLTWSFFLANFLTATDIIGGSAHAASVGGDHGDQSHSSDGSSYAGGNPPDLQHLTLEPMPNDASSQAAQPHVALNPIAGATGSMPDLMPVQVDIPAIQTHMQPGLSTGSIGSTAGNSAINNFYSYDSHDVASSTTNIYTIIDSHDVTTIINTVVQPVVEVVEHVTEIVAPVIGIVDSAVQGTTAIVAGVVDNVGQLADNLTSTLGDTVGSITGTATDVVDGVGHVTGELTTSVAHTLATVTTTATDLVGDVAHAVTDLVGTTSNVTTGVIADASHVVAGATGDGGLVGGVSDLLGHTLGSLGISSSGSLAFAADTQGTFTSQDATAASTGGYSQYNLAVSDGAHDAGPSATSTDTGGITTIITSALGIGSHSTDASQESDNHSNHQSAPVHLTVLDDLHSHLHLGLLG
jgi:hypothetical protein